MSIRNLDHLFRPSSVAAIGASNRPNSVGATVMRNLLHAGFRGAIIPVNPKHATVAGVLSYRRLADLPMAPDLAVICTPPATVPGLIAELGAMGTRAAVVLTAGLSAKDSHGRSLQQDMLAAAKPHLLRVLGPNCVGLIIPGLGLNASFAHTNALSGQIAFVSQSGGLTTAVLDWAKSRGVGFSHLVSLGDSADVDFGDVLDYLSTDPGTRAILLYMESITAARKFMSAARAAARNKTVIVVKAGRSAAGAKAAVSHTGALAGADDVFDAAIQRAGMLRVDTTLDLFAAVETLARAKPLRGERLAIMTNGGGPGVMATDALTRREAKLATLSERTLAQLDAFLPRTWSRANPVDIIGDAPVERYVKTLQALLEDEGSDAVLFIHVPTAIVPSGEIARACAPVAGEAEREVLACWMGDQAVEPARQIFAAAGLPTHATPEEAVNAFLQMVDYRSNQELLMEVPASAVEAFTPDVITARGVVRGVLAAGGDLLNESQAKTVLAAYGIPVVETSIADTPEDAARIAQELGFPVALKVLSPDLTHKSEVGGVLLDLERAEEVLQGARDMTRRLARLRPDARLSGFTVQRMMRRAGGAHELIAGVATDAVFGPVILFGHGGTAVEVIGDRAVGLPPLNMPLARELVSRTRVAKLLAGYRDRPPANLHAIHVTLTRISQLIIDIPEIVELDINPLVADHEGVIALDARMRVEPAAVASGGERLAIRPYPKELEEWMEFDGRRVLLRPIRPEDAPQHQAFFAALDPEDTRLRFFYLIRELAVSQLARMTQIDYDREMTLIATTRDSAGQCETLGEVSAISDPDNVVAELAVVVRSDLKGRGLGSRLLEKIVDYCRERGTARLIGQVRAGNRRMLALAKKHGFAIAPVAGEPTTCLIQLELQGTLPGSQQSGLPER